MRSAVFLSMATSGRSTHTLSPSQWLCRLLSTFCWARGKAGSCRCVAQRSCISRSFAFRAWWHSAKADDWCSSDHPASHCSRRVALRWYSSRISTTHVNIHPLEFRPTARRLEKVTSDMCPAQGQHQLLTLQSQAFVGTVAVTHQHDFDQVF